LIECKPVDNLGVVPADLVIMISVSKLIVAWLLIIVSIEFTTDTISSHPISSVMPMVSHAPYATPKPTVQSMQAKRLAETLTHPNASYQPSVHS